MRNLESAPLDQVAAARRIRIAPSTLAKLRLSGAGPVYCKVGRRVVYLAADIDAYLEGCRRRSTAEEVACAHRETWR